MKRSTLLATVCLLPLLFAGCSSDDLLSLITSQEDVEAEVAGVSNEVLGPVVERFNLLEVFGSVLTKTAGFDCVASGECASGTWEVCPTATGFQFNFDACMLDGEMVTGTITGVGSSTSGTVDFGVSVGNRSFAGFLTFTSSGDCISEGFSQFTLRDGTRTSILGGELTYCPGSAYPNGTLTASVSGAASYTLNATFDGTQAAAIVFDGGNGLIYNCSVGLATGSASCDLPGI